MARKAPREKDTTARAYPEKRDRLFRSWGTLKVEGQRQRVDCGNDRELELLNVGSDPLHVERDEQKRRTILQAGETATVQGANLSSPGRARVRVSEYMRPAA